MIQSEEIYKTEVELIIDALKITDINFKGPVLFL